MVKGGSLSEQDLAGARAELGEGKAVTVWFTAAAVGVPAGGSAKVVSIGDPPEGDFVQVRPAGSRDTMFCAPNELTRVRPTRKRAPKAAVPAPAPAQQESAPAPRAPVPTPRSAPAPAAPALTVVPPPQAADGPSARSTAPPSSAPPSSTPPSAPSSAERARPSAGRAPARPPAGVVVTLTATPEGEWSVEVLVGKKRTVRPTPVSPGEVAKAARALPPVVTEAIESSLEAARTRQLERVERLRAELEAAQRALQDLSD
ncbi:DUF6319 family protein [Pseudonocardia humida]|uniref:Cell wall anchor protein n=1 Tax=Pseudonocardia humida TaxID=2800819 RepID=A0ABT0ZSP7_9PSEU|nr:DUF6319 family protein [Pseudonocardia humida]MCO1653739.1 cell wall anchor protein [Pseudonocardia humida]